MTVLPSAIAQSDAILTQYADVQNYYNPSAIGMDDYVNIRAGARLQWVGVKNAPKDFLALANMPFKIKSKRFGVGIKFSQSTEGLFSTMNIAAQVAYKQKLFGGMLSIGAQIGYVDEKFKGSEIIIPDGGSGEGGGGSSDPDIPTSDIGGKSFDVGAGIHYTHKYFWAGLSAQHLTQPNIKISTDSESGTDDDGYEVTMGRMLYFTAGSNIPIKNTLFEIVPSVLLRTDFKTVQADITARVRYKKFLTFGVGYRTQSAVMAMVSGEFKDFFVGFSYDYATSSLARVTAGSFELFLGYRLKLNLGDKNKNKHKSIRLM